MANNLIKRALTRRRQIRGRTCVLEEPNEHLVLGVEFAIVMAVCLSLLEVAHMAFLGSWNSEVFASITGLTGIIVGLFVGKKT